MDDLTHVPQIPLGKLLGLDIDLGAFGLLNYHTIYMTWIVIGALLVFAFLATRKIDFLPNPFQVVGELIVSSFYGLTKDALDEEMAKKYFPLICALFMFLVLSNWLGTFPKLEEPTKDLNTPLGLGIMGFFIAHYAGIKAKGFGYIKEYFEPIFFMAPLNVIGELSKVVSISFRLYGNMVGGAIIILVVSHLIQSLVLPPFLMVFFNIFIGTIQAFVFTMLTLVYISVQVK